MDKPKVILIDDYDEVTEVLSEFLSFSSIDVVATGKDGKEAVDLYEKYLPDIVVTDFMMPKYDGLYALENIRKINPDAKVIILTGSDGSVFPKLEELGVTSILQKPCNVNKLVETINKTWLNNTIQLCND